MIHKDKHARGEAGVHVEGGRAEATYQSRPANDTAVSVERATENVIDNKSTAIKVQLNKLLVLLRQGPKTTIEIREHGIMMPAARVWQLRNEYKFKIASELVPLLDANGFQHSKCARYHLLEEAGLAKEVS